MPTLDPLIHATVRLQIMSALMSVNAMGFTELRELIGASDGNLATHARKLENAGYIEVKKHFVGRVPLTTFQVTPEGRAAFSEYLNALEALLPPR